MTAYEVRLARSALRQYKKLGGTDRERIREALERLARDVASPGRIPGQTVKSIRGTDDVFDRMRVGDYRVMYDIILADRVVLVLGIVDRADLERWLSER